MEKQLVILGSTGSIGTQSLEVCAHLGYRVVALTANSNIKLLEEQARQFRPELVVTANKDLYNDLKLSLNDLDIKVEAGQDAVCEAAQMAGSNLVLDAIVGIAGLRPVLTALEAKKTVALANKETLIAGGTLVMQTAKQNTAPIIPVDSEHSAIFQCLHAGKYKDVKGITLTASGGPFWGKIRSELMSVTVKDALAHPIWNMGAKITLDSATLMNKGLEFVEAMHLFNLDPDQIEVVIHRQSVVHSAVEFVDGSVIAQMGTPDMRTAIQYAITYPDRLPTQVKRLRLTNYGALTFDQPDLETFACLRVMIQAARAGGLAPCIVNGANEAAVALFLKGNISFLQIGELVQSALENVKCSSGHDLASIETADLAARTHVFEMAERY